MNAKRFRLAGSVLLLVAVGVAGHQPADATGGLLFSAPVTAISAPSGSQSEPTAEPRLVVTPKGRVLVSAQWEQWDCESGKPLSSNAANQPFFYRFYSMCVWASDDGGRTFHVSGGPSFAGLDADFALGSDGAVLESVMAPYGYFSGRVTAGGVTVMRSEDDGRSWQQHDLANSQVVQDRPYLVTTPHEVVLSYTAIPGNIEVVRSTDGGKTFGLPIAVQPVVAGTSVVNMGPAYDPVHHALLVPYAYSTADPTCGDGAAGCFDTFGLATSTDGGLTWTNDLIATLPAGTGTVSASNLAIDPAGHYYLCLGVASGYDGINVSDRDFHALLLSSAGPGAAWTAPRRIDTAPGSALLPWLLATGDGHLDVAYYHSTFADAGTVVRPWDVVVSDSVDGGRTWATSTVASGAYTGTGVDHQARIYDLIGFDDDPAGRLWVAWTDDLGAAAGAPVIRVAHSLPPGRHERNAARRSRGV